MRAHVDCEYYCRYIGYNLTNCVSKRIKIERFFLFLQKYLQLFTMVASETSKNNQAKINRRSKYIQKIWPSLYAMITELWAFCPHTKLWGVLDKAYIQQELPNTIAGLDAAIDNVESVDHSQDHTDYATVDLDEIETRVQNQINVLNGIMRKVQDAKIAKKAREVAEASALFPFEMPPDSTQNTQQVHFGNPPDNISPALSIPQPALSSPQPERQFDDMSVPYGQNIPEKEWCLSPRSPIQGPAKIQRVDSSTFDFLGSHPRSDSLDLDREMEQAGVPPPV